MTGHHFRRRATRPPAVQPRTGPARPCTTAGPWSRVTRGLVMPGTDCCPRHWLRIARRKRGTLAAVDRVLDIHLAATMLGLTDVHRAKAAAYQLRSAAVNLYPLLPLTSRIRTLTC